MHFADLEVTGVTRDSAYVGSVEVTRDDVVNLLEEIDAAPETTAFELSTDNVSVRNSSKHSGEVVLEVTGANGETIRVLRIGAQGVTLVDPVEGSGLQARSSGRVRLVSK